MMIEADTKHSLPVASKRKNALAQWFAAVVGRATIATGRFQIKWDHKKRKDKLQFKPGMRPTGLSAQRRYSARYGAGMAEGALMLQQDDRKAWRYGRRSERVQSSDAVSTA